MSRRAVVAASLLLAAGVPASPAVAAGEGVVFTSTRGGDTELWWSQLDGGGVRRLTSVPGVDVQPAVSPDGRSVAFMSRRSGDPRIWVMDIDGANPRMVSSGPGTDQQPAWSPDGARIAFVSDRAGGSAQIQVMAADGSQPQALTSSGGANGAPAWSPDGRRIAFLSTRDSADGDRTGEVYVMGADGSGQRNVSQRAGSESAPAWTADGAGLVSGRDAGGLWNLSLADASLIQLTDGPTDADPSLTGAGEILFAGSGAAPDPDAPPGIPDVDVYLGRADGSPLRLTADAARDADPAWAPTPSATPSTTTPPSGGSGSTGRSGGSSSKTATTTSPIKGAQVSPRRFSWTGRTKARLVLRARRATTVRVTVQHRTARRTMIVHRAASIRLKTGTTTVRLNRVLGARRLARGRYDVVLTPTAPPSRRVLVPFQLR